MVISSSNRGSRICVTDKAAWNVMMILIAVLEMLEFAHFIGQGYDEFCEQKQKHHQEKLTSSWKGM